MIRLTLAVCATALLAACSQNAADTDTTDPVAEPAAITDDVLLVPLPEATSAAIAEEDLHARVAALADDAFEGRGPGSPAQTATPPRRPNRPPGPPPGAP